MSLLNFLFGNSSAALPSSALGKTGADSSWINQSDPIERQTGPGLSALIGNPQIQQAVGEIARNPQSPLHKGLFGQTGILRDIMGTVGDSLLLQQGVKEQYQPRRDAERLGEAYQGFAENPLDAIQRVAMRNPAMAQEMYKQYMSDKIELEKAAPTIRKTNFEVNDKIRDTAASYLYSAKNQSQWDAIRSRALAYAKANGHDLSEDIPTTYDPNWSMSAAPVKDQATLAETGRHNRATEGAATERNAISQRGVEVQAALGGGRLNVDAAMKGAAANNSASKGLTSAANARTGAANAMTSAVRAQQDIVRIPAEAGLGNVPTGKVISGPGGKQYVSVGGGYMKALK